MSTNKEFQSVINEVVEGSNSATSMVKRVIHITRHLNCVQSWSVEVDIPDDKDLQEDILDAINNEGLDWGRPDSEHIISCDDGMSVRNIGSLPNDEPDARLRQ